jgi:alpha-tubulin suppressor-like RCC1 family protein
MIATRVPYRLEDGSGGVRRGVRGPRLVPLVAAVVLAGSLLVAAAPALAASAGASGWGENLEGQLGNGTTMSSNAPVAVSGLSGVTAITAGETHSLALLSGGTVVAWGDNAYGDLGDGMTTASDVPVAVSGLSEVSGIAAAGYYSVALLGDGTVMAWGANFFGQLGDGGEADSDVPVAVSGLGGVRSIAAGGAHTLALLGDGTVMAWGGNSSGELGDGGEADSDVPVAVSGLSEVAAVAAGEAHSLALLKNGTVMAWGSNHHGQLGDGGEVDSDVPVAVSGLSEVVAVAAGGAYSLALLRDGTVMAWGENNDGQLGDGTFSSSDVPVAVGGLSGVAAIAAGGLQSLALLKDGTVMAWGSNEDGQLGYGSEEPSSDVPVEVKGVGEVTAIADGGRYSLVSGAPPKTKPYPTVTRIEPGDGSPAGGTHVTITGTNFNDVTAVRFGSTGAASFKVESETEITAVSPAGTGSVHVVVTTAEGGDSPIGPSGLFDYAPTVSNAEPEYGPPAGGTHVTITGTNFNEVTAVKFGATPAASVEVLSEDEIKAVSPAGTGLAEVTVETSGGPQMRSGPLFRYTPTVTGVEPGYGPPAGGTQVTITGTNFNEVSAVKFGTAAAVSFKVESETEITAVSPPGTGDVEVTATTTGGESALGERADFNYAPTVTGFSSHTGPPSGGTEVTITGTNFTDAGAVYFGRNQATSFKVESDTRITAVTPAFTPRDSFGVGGGEDDAVGVWVTGPGGSSKYNECGTLGSAFIYEPTITSIEPDSGPVAGGTEVTITGEALRGEVWEPGFLCTLGYPMVHGVMFGTEKATHWNVLSETEMTAVAPPGTGTVDVTVEDVLGSSPITPGDRFSYSPTVTGVEPGHGPPAGGTHVTIKGTNFDEVSAVKFGSAAAASFKVESETEITAVSPPGTGTAAVTVAGPGGTSPTGPSDVFDYAPTITGIEPGYGPPAGGTHVTIMGTNFNEVTGVKFGSAGAASFKVESETEITAVSPPGTGTAAVTVSGQGGTSPTSPSDGFVYAPTVTGIEPREGPSAGGTMVTITGTGFTDVTAVEFGSNQAASFAVGSEDSITAVSPAGTGTVGVTVIAAAGTSPASSAGQFSYEDEVPVVTGGNGPSGPLGTTTGGGSTSGGQGGALTGPTGTAFTLSGLVVSTEGRLRLTVDMPGPGMLQILAKAPAAQTSHDAKRHHAESDRGAATLLIAQQHLTVPNPGQMVVTLTPTAKAMRMLAREGRLTARVTITYTPKGGLPDSIKRTVTLRLKQRR